MSWTNYHSHSHFCDRTASLEQYATQARAEGLRAYGFSSHAPVPFPCAWCMKKERLAAYLAEIQQLKDRCRGIIQLYAGLEIDYIPGVVGPNDPLFAALDYRIGSVHLVEAFSDGQPWEIDGPHGLFVKGLKEIFAGDVTRVVHQYFALTRQMLQEACPDVVGHLDKIKMQNEAGTLFSESADWYQREVIETLEVIASAGVIVEVNTHGIYKKKAIETYPSRWVLERMHTMGIPITLSSDAHHPEEITRGFSNAARTLKEIGFQHLHVLLDGRWQAVGFGANGLLA